MQYPVIVRTEKPGQYIAEPLGLKELRVEAPSETEVLKQVRKALHGLLGSAKLVQVDIPDTPQSNPWLESFGRSADDPLFEVYLEELERARAEDERT